METRSFKRRAPASALFAGALALGAVASGCGGREPSMASRSAAAYQEAVAKGSPIGSGHGGHGEGDNTDHPGMTTPEGSAKPDHGVGGGANEHSEHSPVKAPDSMTGMDHSEPVADPPDAMAGMDHRAMGHGNPAAIPPPAPAPTSSSEIGLLNPSETLAPDEFDRAAAPLPVGGTATGGSGHHGHGAQPAESGGDVASAKAGRAPAPAEAAFTCPMHPEVVRSQPGTCPKCGMTLAKKDKP